MSIQLPLAAFLVVALSASAPAQEKYRVYLGTYTGPMSQGIYQCELNLKDGSLSTATLAGETSSPSFVALHPDKKFLYVTNENSEGLMKTFDISDPGNFKPTASYKAAPNAIVFNLYGPTEATIAFSYFRIDPEEKSTGQRILSISIVGRKPPGCGSGRLRPSGIGAATTSPTATVPLRTVCTARRHAASWTPGGRT